MCFAYEVSIVIDLCFIRFFAANSPENKAKWAEGKKKEAAEHHH